VLISRINCSEVALQFAQNETFLFHCRVNTGIVCEQSKTSSRLRNGAKTKASSIPAVIIHGVEKLPSTKIRNFLRVRIGAISLIDVVSQRLMLYRRHFPYPRTQQLSTNCWNLGWRGQPASYLEVSNCNLLEHQSDFVFNKFLSLCVFGLLSK
jgi:hypothetical protein